MTDFSPRGILYTTQAHLWQLLNPWKPSEYSLALKSMWWHLGGMGADRHSMINASRAACVGLSAAVWSRFELKHLGRNCH